MHVNANQPAKAQSPRRPWKAGKEVSEAVHLASQQLVGVAADEQPDAPPPGGHAIRRQNVTLGSVRNVIGCTIGSTNLRKYWPRGCHSFSSTGEAALGGLAGLECKADWPRFRIGCSSRSHVKTVDVTKSDCNM